ncbi:hypothetical protein IWW38_005167, partial [Coemansia aciculifera]
SENTSLSDVESAAAASAAARTAESIVVRESDNSAAAAGSIKVAGSTNGSAADTSASSTPADLSRAQSDLSTKVPGTGAGATPAVAGSAASLAAAAAAAIATTATTSGPTQPLPPIPQAPGKPGVSSTSLLARIPKTPDGTDAGSLESPSVAVAAGRGGAKKHQASGSVARPPVPLHRPTTCPCGSSGKTAHYSMEALDAVFPLSLPLLFRIVFSASVPSDIERLYMPADFVSKDELERSCTKRIKECGNMNVKTEGWVPDPSDNGLEMCIYSYEKPLGFAIGPKSAVVEDTFRITVKDFDKVVVVDQVVRTPYVPSGTAFFVKIRHCLTWASGPGNQPPGGWSHYRMTFEVEWVKSSWIKSAIEKGSVDSNKQAAELSEKYIREWVAAHPGLEVKPQSAIGGLDVSAAAVAAAAAGHKRGRKPLVRKSKRDASPRGLRMEELLGADSSERSSQLKEEAERRVERGVNGGPLHASSAAALIDGAAGSSGVPPLGMVMAAGSDSVAAAWKRRAEAS